MRMFLPVRKEVREAGWPGGGWGVGGFTIVVGLQSARNNGANRSPAPNPHTPSLNGQTKQIIRPAHTMIHTHLPTTLPNPNVERESWPGLRPSRRLIGRWCCCAE